MNDDCDRELPLVAQTFARYSDEAATMQSELGSSRASGVDATGTSGGGDAAALSTSVVSDDVRLVIEATAEPFVGSSEDRATSVSAAMAVAPGVRGRTVTDGIRALIRATADVFMSGDTDANSDSDPVGRATGTRGLARGTDAPALTSHAAAEVDESAAEVEVYEADPNAPALSRKVKPRIRTKRTRMRSRTIAMKRLTRAELQRGALENPHVEGVVRPTTRSECSEGARPCPWVACKHHLYLDINPRTGSIKINFPDLEPWELKHTCALDVADNGGLTLEEIGLITNLTRERVRQVEVRGLLTLKQRSNTLR